MSRYDVIVLGVGGMGAAALYHLAARGLRVVGIERDDVPSLRGSSVGQTRIIRKAYFEDARYVPLLRRSYDLWKALAEETGEPLYVRTGCLNLGPADHPDIRGVLEAAVLHALPHERLDAQAIGRRFPAFTPGPAEVGVFEEDAGYLRVEHCTSAHARAAVARGAELRTRTMAREVAIEGGEVRVVLENGEELRGDRLVLSAGPWLVAAELRELAAALPPIVVTRQVQLWFRPRDVALATAPAMPAFIHFVGERAYYGLPLAEPLESGEPGVKVCRHHDGEPTTPEALDRTLRSGDEEDVRGYIDAHLPNAGGPRVSARVCMYTSTPDRNFVVGVHPSRPEVVVLGGFSGHGYKMASVMGEIAADLAERGTTKHDIALFDPARR